KKVDRDPHNALLKEEEAITLKEYNSAAQDEEKLLFQHARIDWLSNGDKNSKFFHVVIRGRAHKRKFEVINDETGNKHESRSVPDIFVKYFQSFLGNELPVQAIDLSLLNGINKITKEDACYMIRRVINEEVKQDLFDIFYNKAPDSYTSKFNKKAWGLWEVMYFLRCKNFVKTKRRVSLQVFFF
nr:hypothetical protein [Tanacetum cinerariifolium]